MKALWNYYCLLFHHIYKIFRGLQCQHTVTYPDIYGVKSHGVFLIGQGAPVWLVHFNLLEINMGLASDR